MSKRHYDVEIQLQTDGLKQMVCTELEINVLTG